MTAALSAPRALLGPFETVAAFCTAANLTAEQRHLTPTDDTTPRSPTPLAARRSPASP